LPNPHLVFRAESAPVQEGCVPGASPYPNPFMQVSEFSDAGPHGDRRKAQVTEMTSAWQQPGPSGTPTAPYTSHMMFDPSYYISSAHGMYLSRPGGGSGAFSPQMMQTAHVGGYPASTDTCIPVGRPHSVEPRGVYSPFYGYSHSCTFISVVWPRKHWQFQPGGWATWMEE
jgi:hypothetical protein